MVQIKISLSARRLAAAAQSPVSLHFPCLHPALNKPSPETNIQTLGGDTSPSHLTRDLQEIPFQNLFQPTAGGGGEAWFELFRRSDKRGG